MIQPDKVIRSTCPYCGVGCQVDLSVKDEHIIRVEAPFDARWKLTVQIDV